MKQDKDPLEEEFDKLLQEFLKEDSTSDDADTNDENTNDDETQRAGSGMANDDEDQTPRFGDERHYIPEMTKVKIQVQPHLFDSVYVNGDIAVTLYGKRGANFPEDRFQLHIMAEGYYPMACSKSYCEAEKSSKCVITYTMMSPATWLPGRYVLYVRDTTDDSLIQMPFTLDEKLEATVGDAQPCLPCSKEDILTSVIDGNSFDWNNHIGLLPGLAQVRNYVVCQQQLEVYNEFRKDMRGEKLLSKGHLLIQTCNRDLTSKQLYYLSSLVAHSYTFSHLDCATLFDAVRNNPYEPLFEELSVTGKHVFCLTNPGALLSTGGKTIIKKIIDKVRDDESEHLLWICGCKQDIEALLSMFPSLGAFFPKENRLEQEPYKDFEIVHAFFEALKEERLYCSIEAMDGLAHAVLQGYRKGALSTWTVNDIRQFAVEQVKPRYLDRCYQEISDEHLPLVELSDLCLDQLTSIESNYEQCLKDLDAMVGLDEVKQGIRQMAANTSFFAERRRRGLTTSQKATFHCIFTGNPGTGKTTVAKQLGKIYRALGLLSKGDVIAVDRTRLVGRYIGETEENMKTILDEARGNVLFIDEAYTLFVGGDDRKDFGARVIDSLLTVLSQPNPDMLIIFAGYLKEMDTLLNTNPGLMGRFPYKYQFKDYDAEQLFTIACRLLQHDDYRLSVEAEALLRETIAMAYAQRDANFSNARWVEQFVGNGIIPAMATRLSQSACDDYQTIESSDIRQAYAKFNPKATALKPRQKVGFSA